MAAEAIAFMQARKPGDRPFFISLNPGSFLDLIAAREEAQEQQR